MVLFEWRADVLCVRVFVCVCLLSVLKPVFGPYTICGCWPFLPHLPPPPSRAPTCQAAAHQGLLAMAAHTCTCVCARVRAHTHTLLTFLSAASTLPQPLHFLSRQSKPLPHLFFSPSSSPPPALLWAAAAEYFSLLFSLFANLGILWHFLSFRSLSFLFSLTLSLSPSVSHTIPLSCTLSLSPSVYLSVSVRGCTFK